MTTIAYDGKTLAADRCSWCSGVRRAVCKVQKVSHARRGDLLVAFAGDAGYAGQVLDWLIGAGPRPDPLTKFDRQDLNIVCAVAVDRNGRIWEINRALDWCEFDEPIFAHGAGQEFAWGALEAGADAVRAVEIAAKRSDYAALGVDSVSF